MSNLKIAIAALVRGYDNLDSYHELIERNRHISENIELKNNHEYKYILFHEGNIFNDHQKYIQDNTDFKINFIDASHCFDISKELENSAIKESGRKYKSDKGYRLMCRFNSYYIWSYLKDFDYVFRIDEDCLVQKFDKNQFDIMFNNEITFCFSRYSIETHKYTNQYLPDYLKKNLNTKRKNIYNHKFPYTNVYISNVNFWLNPEVNSALKKTSLSNEQYVYRWGDLPILGAFLNFYKPKTSFFNYLTYKHLSHSTEINVRNTAINYIFQNLNSKTSKLSYFFKDYYLNLKATIRKYYGKN